MSGVRAAPRPSIDELDHRVESRSADARRHRCGRQESRTANSPRSLPDPCSSGWRNRPRSCAPSPSSDAVQASACDAGESRCGYERAARAVKDQPGARRDPPAAPREALMNALCSLSTGSRSPPPRPHRFEEAAGPRRTDRLLLASRTSLAGARCGKGRSRPAAPTIRRDHRYRTPGALATSDRRRGPRGGGRDSGRTQCVRRSAASICSSATTAMRGRTASRCALAPRTLRRQ